jgi:hypothetical protein
VQQKQQRIHVSSLHRIEVQERDYYMSCLLQISTWEKEEAAEPLHNSSSKLEMADKVHD